MKNAIRLVAVLIAAAFAMRAQTPGDLISAFVGDNFVSSGTTGFPGFVAPGSDSALKFALITYLQVEGADSYNVRVTFLLGDERRTELKVIDSATACPGAVKLGTFSFTPACMLTVVLARGPETLQPVKLLSVTVDGQKTVKRIEWKSAE